MKLSQPEQVFQDFATDCSGCRLCAGGCSLLEKSPFTPAEIAKRLLADDLSPELIGAVQRCSLCGLCGQLCPHGLNPAELMQTARIHLVACGQIDISDYQLMLVDTPDHFFRLYRDTWGINYRDLEKQRCPTLFFPGCSLSSYAPELTRAACNWLVEQDYSVGMSSDCCGLPLLNIGLVKRAEAHLERLQDELSARRVEQVVTSCPNCFYFLREHLVGVQVSSLYQLMSAVGTRIAGQPRLSVHDSCPDRYSGEIGWSLRTLLPEGALVELPNHGSKTRCCGAGGMASLIDYHAAEERTNQRREEIVAASATTCVSACMACVKRLGGGCMESASRNVNHILELVFERPLVRSDIDRRLELMWQGEDGERNMQRLNAKVDALSDIPPGGSNRGAA
ncbi:MAG: hypothetical protein C0622_07750 [Desulfuromonas sp.]|nr:MAG: hypothetical protein C0622_07750 [Desulfuromonas sp.]